MYICSIAQYQFFIMSTQQAQSTAQSRPTSRY